MATLIGARSNEDRDIQIVAVTAVNIPENKAECMTRIRSMIYVDISYPVGGIYITPSVGDQWYVERIDTIWRLFGRIPFNDNNIQIDPVEGQQIFGGTGPVVMNGSTLDIRSPLQMNPVPDDEMPDPATMPPGTMIYSETQGLVVSDGSGEWVPTGGGGDIEDIEGLTEILDNKIDKPLIPLVPGTNTKISYDENGLVIGSEEHVVAISDVADLDTTLDGKSDVGHGHTEDEITNLTTDLAGKAAVDHVHGEDGEALDPDLIDIGALTPANLDFIQRIADHWTNVPPSAVKSGLDLSFLDLSGVCTALQIPPLDATKIVSGTFLQSMIPTLTPDWISGIFDPAQIPSLTPDWITGIFDPAQIPTLTPDWITGIFDPAQIPTLTPDWITGIFDPAQIPALDLTHIPNLPASQITSGVLNLLRIPGLDVSRIPALPADQITSGTFLDALIPNLAASKITSGVFNLLRIPGLDLSRIPELPADQITSGTFPQSMLDITNIAAGIVSGVLGGAQIPNLDASKITSGEFLTSLIPNLDTSQITSGTFPQSMLNITSIAAGIISGALSAAQIPSLDASKIGSGTFITSLIPALDASKITSGQFLTGMIPALDAAQITSGTFPPTLIPGLDAGKITSGIFPQDMLDITNIDTSWITGILGDTQIPDLDASKIVSGTFPQSMLDILDIPASLVSGILAGAQIPSLDASKIGSGTFLSTLIPSLDASKITSGVLGGSLIPGLPASQITSGTFLSGLIPALDASKVTTGQFPQSMLNITAIAAGIISGTLGVGNIPALDAAKITSGTFLTGLIPSLDATKITSGVLGLAQIPGLDLTRIPNLPASQITSGVFGGGLIPTLDASKIGSGVFDLLRLPGMPASQITSGTFPQNMITNLTQNLGSIFTTITSPTKPELLQNVPLGSIGQTNPEMLINPNYDSLGSVAGGSTNWTWDPAVSHTAGGTGSAKYTCNGTTGQLLSDPPIPVSPNQVLAISHWLQWSGVTATPGVAFRLSVASYLGAGISNTVDIQVISTPGASSGWVQLSGQFTVPASGVDNIRLQLTVTSMPTAGSVWWDDGSVKKVQLLSESFTSGLPGDLSNLLTGINARTLITDTTALMNTLGAGVASLTAIGDRLANLGAGGLFNAGSLSNITGIPMVPNANVTGIGGAFNVGTSIQETWNAVSGAALGGLADITNRLTNLNTGGIFNASALTNLLNIGGVGLMPQATIPALDGSIIQFGKVPIGQIPIGNLPTQLNRITLPDVGQTLDQMTNAWIGASDNPYSLTDPTQARQSMDSFYREFLNLSQKMQDIRSSQTATDVSGISVTFNFSQYPDGPAPSEFTVTLTGAGTSVWGIKSGGVGWRTPVNNGNRTATAVYNVKPTNTNFQIVRGTLSGAPPGDSGGSKPRIAAIGRVDDPANPRNYVWARGYNDGFLAYKGDIGCTINGVETVWQSGIPLTWSMDISFVIGAGGNPRRYQVFSGTQLVVDLIEPGTLSKINNGTTDPINLYRYWGVRSELKTDSGNAIAPPFIVGSSVSDNQPPAVVGSTFRAYRASTGSVNFNGWNQTPTNFFDSPAYRSPDMLWDGTNLTVGIEGTYLVNIRYAVINLGGQERADCSVFKNHAPIRKMGGMWSYNSYEGNMFGTALVYLKVNEVLTPGYSTTDTVSVNGETSGTDTFFEVTLVNRSTA